MAWQLSQSKITSLLQDNGARKNNDEDFHKKVREDLKKSWETITDVFPSHESD